MKVEFRYLSFQFWTTKLNWVKRMLNDSFSQLANDTCNIALFEINENALFSENVSEQNSSNNLNINYLGFRINKKNLMINSLYCSFRVLSKITK